MGNCLKSKQPWIGPLLGKDSEASIQSNHTPPVSYSTRFNNIRRIDQPSPNPVVPERSWKINPRVNPSSNTPVTSLQEKDKLKTSGSQPSNESLFVQNHNLPGTKTYTVEYNSRLVSMAEENNREEEAVKSIGSGKLNKQNKDPGQVLPSSRNNKENETLRSYGRRDLTDSNNDQRLVHARNRENEDNRKGSVNEGPYTENLDRESGSKYKKQIKELKAQVKELIAEKEKLLNRNRDDEDNRKGNVNESPYTENLNQESGSIYIKQIIELKAQVEELIVEKGKLLNRLSEIGAMKLTDNNPNVTDLSDPNRPEKLVEQFCELYDNEWTDAYQLLTKTHGKQIDQSANLLLGFLKKIYDLCLSSTKKRANKFRKAMMSYAGLSGEVSSQLELQEIERKMWELRMKKSECNVARVEKEVMKNLQEQLTKLDTGTSNNMSLYIKGCVRICWYMCIRNPPMHLDFGETEESSITNNNTPATRYFDKSKFSPYTKAGKYIDYVVWPAVFLHDGGSIMRKGVAQGSPVIINTLVDA